MQDGTEFSSRRCGFRRLRKNKPPEGSVQVLKVTEKQFQKMDYMVGSLSTSILNDDERLVVL